MADNPTLNIRRQFVDANREVADDLLGRKQPRTLGLPALASCLMNGGKRPERIPDQYWALDVNDAGYSVAVVSCPCGMTPQVEIGSPITPCRIYEGDLRSWDPEKDPMECERGYTFTGEAVFVWNSPRNV